MSFLTAFIGSLVFVLPGAAQTRTGAASPRAPEPRVEPVETRRVEPSAVLSWPRIVLYDRELERAHRRPWPEQPPEPVAQVLHDIPGPARRAPARQALAPGATATSGSCAGHASEPPLSTSFLALADTATLIPPDTNGAIGPGHAMTMLNDRVQIQDRSGFGGTAVGLDAFWTSVGFNVFDPKLRYDASAGRWYATGCSHRRSSSSRVVFAVSASSDPTGLWSFYSLDADPANVTWVDFPGIGGNSQWIVITGNMFTIGGDAFQGAKMWVLDRATVLAGGALTVSVFPTGFDQLTGGELGSTIAPCDTYDAAETTLYLVNNNFSSVNGPLIRLSQLTGTGSTPSWSPVAGSSYPDGGFFDVELPFGRSQSDAPQLGDARLIETNDTKILSALERNGSVWLTHSGEQGGTTGVLWYQIDPAALPDPIVQSGWIWSASEHHYFPSLAVNCAGDACLGFTRSSATRYAEAAYAVRLAADAPGTFGPVRQLRAGEDRYYKTFGGSRNRWGDYSVTVVDPVDDKGFWTIQEYAAERGGAGDNGSRWGTQWGRIGSCGAPTLTQQPQSATVCAGRPVPISVSATASNPPLHYQWRKNGVELPSQTGSALSIPGALASDQGTYDVVVRDGCGEVTSQSATLTVLPGVFITLQPFSQDACLNDAAYLQVFATGAGLTYQWRKDGVALPGAVSSNLALNAVALSDAGTYDVLVSGSGGCTVPSDPAVLQVLSIPITQQPQGAVRCVGRQVTFSVAAAGTGLSYQWRKEGVPLPDATQSTLTLESLTLADAGTYDVLVSGSSGCAISAAAELVVEYCGYLPKKL